MPVSAPRGAAALGIAILAIFVNGSCSPDTPKPPVSAATAEPASPSAAKRGTGLVRTDLRPLTKRFSALGEPISATWLSGTLDGSVPGPSTYWIDAVVTLSPETATSLRTMATTTASDSPELSAQVRAQVPAGELRRSPALDAEFAQGPFRAQAYLVEATDVIVLVALGQ